MILKFSWKIPHLCTRAKFGAETVGFPRQSRAKRAGAASAHFQPYPRDRWGKIINMSLGRGLGHPVNCRLVAESLFGSKFLGSPSLRSDGAGGGVAPRALLLRLHPWLPPHPGARPCSGHSWKRLPPLTLPLLTQDPLGRSLNICQNRLTLPRPSHSQVTILPEVLSLTIDV